VSGHVGYAMHTFQRNARKITPKYPVLGNIPENVVEHREEMTGEWVDHFRRGTGDHQGGSAIRYHPLVGDLFLQKHIEHNGQDNFPMYMQQYGLERPQGNVFKAGHGPGGEETGPGTGRLQLSHNGDVAEWEGSMRPCGQDIITAFISKKGHTCAKISSSGSIKVWNTISNSVSDRGGMGQHRLTRLATLGSPESEARCDRFLMGYEEGDNKRYLQEVDGNCNKLGSPMEVTAHAMWPIFGEWTTTKEGAVVWVTTSQLEASAREPYPPRRSQGEGDNPPFAQSQGATNMALVSVYYPDGGVPQVQSSEALFK